MNATFQSINVKFGVFAITAIVFLSGCSVAPTRMDRESLDYFVVDCRYKEQQLNFVRAQRVTGGQAATAQIVGLLTPWKAVTDPEGAQKNYDVGYGRHDWQLNQILHELSRCP